MGPQIFWYTFPQPSVVKNSSNSLFRMIDVISCYYNGMNNGKYCQYLSAIDSEITQNVCVWVCILFVNRILLGSERGSSRSNCKIGWKIPDFIEYENLLLIVDNICQEILFKA